MKAIYTDCGYQIIRDKKTKEYLGVRWVFDSVDESGRQETSFISKEELGEDMFLVLKEEARVANNLERKTRRHENISIDALDYESEKYSSRDVYFAEEEREESVNLIEAFKLTLPPKQRMYFEIKEANPGISNRKIAEMCGVDHKAVDKAFKAIKLKFANFAI